jgi:hypothetical protein
MSTKKKHSKKIFCMAYYLLYLPFWQGGGETCHFGWL